MSRPIPWPTRVLTIDSPAASTCSWTAWETSPRRLPGRHCPTPANSASSVTVNSFRAIGVVGPPADTPPPLLPASRSIVRTRIVPAAAIRSISADVFLMIIGRSDVVFQTKCGDHRPDVIVNLVGAARSVDPPHQSLLVVVVG